MHSLLFKRPAETGAIHAGKPVSEQKLENNFCWRPLLAAEHQCAEECFHYFGEDYRTNQIVNIAIVFKSKNEIDQRITYYCFRNHVLLRRNKTEYVIDFLTGKDSSDIETYGHDKLEEFGSGSDERSHMGSRDPSGIA